MTRLESIGICSDCGEALLECKCPTSSCMVDSVVGIIERCVHGCDMQIPFYAYGDNQAACEMADRLNQIRDDLVDALNIINSNA